MNVNLIDFNMAVGRRKPRTFQGMPNQSACPFCDVEHLQGIIDRQDNIILLKNKYNVMEPSYQLVLIETDKCNSDIPEYSAEHMHRLMQFALKHWLSLINSGDYKSVVLFKNFGPLSGGTLRHPHMQIIGFPEIDPNLMYEPAEFQGTPVISSNGCEVNISSQPRVGFTEININLLPAAYPADAIFAKEKEQLPAPMPLSTAIDTLADYIKGTVSFLQEIHQRDNFSYNLFFYIYQGRVHVRLMPRYPTSPLFIGYSIHLNPTNREQVAVQLRERLAAKT